MYQITVVGGDRRMIEAALLLKAQGCAVTLCATCEKPEGFLWKDTLGKTAEGDLLLLPVPYSKDQKTVFGAPEVSTDDAKDACARFRFVCGGGLPSALFEYARKAGGDAIDLLCDEAFTLENAYLTAYAALGMLLLDSGKAPHDTRILLLGYGRIASALCRLLLGAGFCVCVCARDPIRRREAAFAGAKETFAPSELAEAIKDADTIVNTVPFPLLKEADLPKARELRILELASGENFEKNLPACVSLVCAPGLPGKVYPVSAGALIAEAAIRFLTQKTRI
ncbi:MAG: NAD(P)-binding domain-containing protein [Clostridia bacterium]|nr:NAD(P)-binding domain-containing protein [Clostridia bacterium]